MNLSWIDESLFRLINQGLSNGVFDVLMPRVTGRATFLFLPYFFYLAWKRCESENAAPWARIKQVALCLLFPLGSLVLADSLGNELKHLLLRVRPCNVLTGVNLLVGGNYSPSLPSNHAANTFAVATALYYLSRGFIPSVAKLYPFAVAGIVGFSRVYVGVHYPLDVLAGGLLGSAVSLLLLYGHAKITKRFWAARPWRAAIKPIWRPEKEQATPQLVAAE